MDYPVAIWTIRACGIGGGVVLTNRPRVWANGTYEGQILVEGTFTISGHPADMLKIVFGSSGTMFDSIYGEAQDGMKVFFGPDDWRDNSTGNVGVEYPGVGYSRVLVNLDVGIPYDFKIEAMGSTINIYLGNLTNPVLTAPKVDADGDKVYIYNREKIFSTAFTTTIDKILISSQPVPEPSASFLISGMLLIGLTWRSRG